MSESPKRIWIDPERDGNWTRQQVFAGDVEYTRRSDIAERARELLKPDVTMMYSEELEEWLALVRAFLKSLSEEP